MTGAPIRVPPGFRIIAHRGASGYAPENTRVAFERAASMGVHEIEFDLQLTKDGRMVVIHDTVLDRYGYPGLRVAEMALGDFKKLDMAAWFGNPEFGAEPVLTADELFEAFGRRFIYHAEIKAPSRVLAVSLADCLGRHELFDATVVTSFDFDVLVEYRELAPDQLLGWLVRAGNFTAANVQRAAAAGILQFCPAAADVSAERVADAKKQVREVRAHGVKSRGDAERVVLAGCDGMTINWPDWLAVG
jgi:glycerophosphoryl diester phosphodiesterase